MHLEQFAVLASIAATAKCVLAASVIIKRSSDTYAANCDAAPPANSGYKPPEFPSMKSVLQKAFIDATSLASAAFDITQNIGEVQANNAYNHYYDSEFTNAEEMLGHVNSLSLWINAGSNNQVPTRWSVNFDCSGKLKGCSGSPKSLAVTDPAIGSTLVEICPLFWTTPSSAFLLPGNGPQPPVNSKPYRSLDGSGWCNKRQTANFFATAGHTILHELSHLNSIGQLAGLAPDGRGLHGTGDFQDEEEDGCELSGARKYLKRWQADRRDTVASPDYNAESLAGFSTEYFFSTQCTNLDNIPE